MKNLVTTDWLAAELTAPDLILFDASYYLPAENIDARARYAVEHIPGARFFDIDEIADPSTTLPHMVPSASRFEHLLGAMGVSNSTRMVFYDQRGLFSAARGWWLMCFFGHESVAILDGGLPKWRRELRSLVNKIPPAAVPQPYVASLRSGLLRVMDDLVENLRTHRELVLDARSRPRFEGTVPEPRAGVVGGHIPGSRSLPFGELLNADGTMLSPDRLRALFATLGVEPDTQVIASCGSGVTAPLITLGLAVAGYLPGAVYDGSWTEWGGSDAPIETGRL